MSRSARDLLVRGIAAAKDKAADEARFYLEWVLRIDADPQQQVQARLWLSRIEDVPQKKRKQLETALAIDPWNPEVRRELAILDGRLNPEEVIDPNKPLPTPTDGQTSAKAQRFTCPRCSGNMTFIAGDNVLRCAYCGYEQHPRDVALPHQPLRERDFTVAMATIEGHVQPVGTQTLACRGCGASFLLPRDVLSLTCSYCGSSHVVELRDTRRLVPPEGVIPFAVPLGVARQAMRTWFRRKKLKGVKMTPIRGMYWPAWTFDLGGEIRWWVSVEGERKQIAHQIYEDDILVPASRKLPEDLALGTLLHYRLSAIVPYDEGYLADWPAEVYEISVSDASLVARRIALNKFRQDMQRHLERMSHNVLSLDTSEMIVESFKLVLLPLWVAHYRYNETDYIIAVNGQTEKVQAQEPVRGLRRLLGSLWET